MLNALQPIMKALAGKELLRHSDMDVKVAVASCISEITRITAPDAPYDDDIMKVWCNFLYMVLSTYLCFEAFDPIYFVLTMTSLYKH